MYYTPNIEEFHVGFEYEFHGMTTGGLSILDAKENKLKKIKDPDIKIWTKERFYKDDFGILNRSLDSIEDLMSSGQIRVKYLDREDIESLGFFNTKRSSKDFFTDKNYCIILEKFYKDKGHRVDIMFDGISLDSNEFVGYIKNKSELKRLLVQLDIKKQ